MPGQEVNLTNLSAFYGEIQQITEETGGKFSLFVVDVGDVGKIFARSGYAAREKYLLEAALRLNEFCRNEDRLCRIGDSKFGILLADVSTPGHQSLAAEKIVRMHKEAVESLRTPAYTAIRIGIASFPEHSVDPIDLTHKASIALESTLDSAEPYATFSPDLANNLSIQWNMHEELRIAITDNLLDVFYQPKIDIASGRAVGAEALVRWNSPEHGQVSPDIFIPVASQIGLLKELTQHMVTTSLRNSSEWPHLSGRLSVSVNIDATDLNDAELIKMVTTNLSIWGCEHCDLILEITEGALVADSESNFRNLNQLREAGVGISIDDFGTGYSSLSYFKDIPATELKIDRSFVNSMIESKQYRNLVEAIIWLAHRFNLSVVAEGVETKAEFEMLSHMKCDVVQGFYIAEPLSQVDFCAWLEKYALRAHGNVGGSA